MIFKLILILCAQQYVLSSTGKPHIITIIADDLGWNDVGFHGSDQIPTPNIDALAYNGLILNRHYTQPTCTPSRAALMTGKYPIRLGLQGQPITPNVKVGLPLTEKILPQHLKDLGYVTRLIGKWHLGHYTYDFTPTKRGFDSHFGYYNGWIRYNDSVLTAGNKKWGYDAWNNHDRAADRFKGKYATDVFTEEAVNIIKNHDTSTPLFLDVSHVAVHAGFNNLLQVRNEQENNERFANIEDQHRRLFAGVLTALDESVGKLMVALDEKNMLENSIILFIADNGGATMESAGNEKSKFKNSASNWPLRGMKSSITEGGVRGVAAIWSPLFKSRANSVSNTMVHLTDWLPTFYAAAGGDIGKLGIIDGVNQWPYLTGKENSPARKELLINFNEKNNDGALIIDDWKFIRVNNSRSVEYSGVSGRDSIYSYSMEKVLQTKTHTILNKFPKNDISDPASKFAQLRSESTISENCKDRINVLGCFRKGCLFNIKNDPCEFNDQSENKQDLRIEYEKKLNSYRDQVVPQQNIDEDKDYDPKKFGNYWTPWVNSFGSVIAPRISTLLVGEIIIFLMYIKQ
ncbi:arylsulfatase B-like [Planococcus citri]|uniref:arylsulfatase B-like n=1 Tax=Planococcus citri TaxID=170843 RepID=UPI0031F85A1D